jgi:hypothetical protein
VKWATPKQLAWAARYPIDEADSVVANVNRNAKTPHEQAMLLSTARAYTARGSHPFTPETYDHGRGCTVLDEMLAAHGYGTPQRTDRR